MNENQGNCVQAFINNIVFPKTMPEVLLYCRERGGFDVEGLIEDADSTGYTEWSVPRWAKIGDVVFFMHSKTSIQTIRRLNTEFEREYFLYSDLTERIIADGLEKGRELYRLYGGKIFAVGRVCGVPFYEQNQSEELHWKNREYAGIDSLTLLEHPVDISEFNSFITVSRQSGITGVFGKEFEQLKKLIGEKNELPEFLHNAVSMSIPLSRVNRENWLRIVLEYRYRFFLESQFRSYYTDFFLAELGDRKTFYRECPCERKGCADTFADNVILLAGKYLPVEIKLNIRSQSDLGGQLRQYCRTDKLWLNRQKEKQAEQSCVIPDRVMVMDTDGIYLYRDGTGTIDFLASLDDFNEVQDIREFREILIKQVLG